MSVARWAVVALCLCALPGAWAHDEEPEGWDVNVGLGPLALREQFLLSQAHLMLTPQDPRPTDRGRFRVGLTLDWANNFGRKGRTYLVDGETLVTVPYVRYGVLEGFEIGLDLPIHWRGGGSMDDFIQDFHDAFGVSQNGREDRPDDDFTVFLNDRQGNFYQIDDEGWGLGNVGASAKLTFAQGDERLPALSIQALVTAPTGDQRREFSQGGWDGGLVLAASKGFCGKFYLYGNAGLTVFSNGSQGPIDLNTVRGFFMLGAEYRFSRRFSLVLQTSVTTPYLDEGYLEDWTWIAGFGPKIEIGERCKVELGVLENYGGFDVSADFGVHLGVEVGF